jgi:hypothetical protein
MDMTGPKDLEMKGEISMKRRSVMRLLAVAIAASLAATSPAVPASLTTVFAESAGETTTVNLTDAKLQISNADVSASNLGVGATIAVTGIDTTKCSFQWKADDKDIAGATDASLELATEHAKAKISVEITITDSTEKKTIDTGTLKVKNAAPAAPTSVTVSSTDRTITVGGWRESFRL